MSHDDEDFYNDYYDRTRSYENYSIENSNIPVKNSHSKVQFAEDSPEITLVSNSLKKSKTESEFQNEPETDNECFESDSDDEESRNHFVKPAKNRYCDNNELAKAAINLFKTCDQGFLNYYISNNLEKFKNLMRYPDDEFILVFNSRLIYMMKIEHLETIVNHRDFYPNPFFLKNCNTNNFEDFCERLQYIQKYWWKNRKIYIRKTDDSFFGDQKVLILLNHFNIILVQRRRDHK